MFSASSTKLCNIICNGTKKIQPLVSAAKNVRYISYLQLNTVQRKDGISMPKVNKAVLIENKWSLKSTVCMRSAVSTRYYSSYPDHELVRLPNLSPTMEVGTIVSWEKEEGSRVEEGEVLALIETDKSTMEMETPEEGYLAKIIIPAGTKDIPVNKLIAVIVTEEDDVDKFKDFSGDVSTAPPSPPPDSEGSAAGIPTPAVLVEPPPPPSSSARVFASPMARRMALQKGIDINMVQGSGPRGRITEADVESFKRVEVVSSVPPTPPPSVAPSAPAVPPPPPPPPVMQPTPRAAAAAPPPPAQGAMYTDLDLSNMRKTIAKRLTESKQNIPHYYLSVDIVMDEVMALRKQLNDDSNGKFKLSVNDFVIKASALSLLKVPECNSQWMQSFIRQFNNVDISVAVSTEGGLITPILFDADKKGLLTINQEVSTLAEKARNKTIQPHEFVGGTFSISNLGMYGITNFSAVINPPQSCILAVGGTQDRLLPDNSEKGFRSGKVMSVTLSCDHRVVDGAVGAQWLKEFRTYLEKPINMLL